MKAGHPSGSAAWSWDLLGILDMRILDMHILPPSRCADSTSICSAHFPNCEHDQNSADCQFALRKFRNLRTLLDRFLRSQS